MIRFGHQHLWELRGATYAPPLTDDQLVLWTRVNEQQGEPDQIPEEYLNGRTSFLLICTTCSATKVVECVGAPLEAQASQDAEGTQMATTTNRIARTFGR